MKRVAELDSIRGLASLAILGHHLGLPTLIGGFAVDLFFVLSGYLITRIVLNDSGSRGFLTRFYIRRGLRIWPIYYLTIAVCVAWGLIVLRPCVLDALPYYLTYTQFVYVYFNAPSPPINIPLYHTWTLAIEEQFYMIWPAAILLVGTRRVIPLAVAGLAATFAARYGRISIWTLLGRMDGLLLGAILAALLVDGRATEPAWRRRLTAGFGAAMGLGPLVLGASLLAERRWAGIGDSIQVVLSYFAINLTFFGLVGLLVLFAGRSWLAPLRWRPLCGIGLISYGLYLYHVPLMHAAGPISQHFGWPSGHPAEKLAVALASFAAAIASWHFIEKPILALKDRIPAAKAPARAVDVVAAS